MKHLAAAIVATLVAVSIFACVAEPSVAPRDSISPAFAERVKDDTAASTPTTDVEQTINAISDEATNRALTPTANDTTTDWPTNAPCPPTRQPTRTLAVSGTPSKTPTITRPFTVTPWPCDTVTPTNPRRAITFTPRPITRAAVTRPPAQPTAQQQVAPTKPPAPTKAQAACPSTSYNCSQLICAQAYACLAAGARHLDRDGDGKPCEAQCGG